VRPKLSDVGHKSGTCLFDRRERYDAGDKLGYLKAVIDFAMEREDLRRELAQYVENRS
jgi:UTP-glucose-1-phosphate uridylyltransferase